MEQDTDFLKDMVRIFEKNSFSLGIYGEMLNRRWRFVVRPVKLFAEVWVGRTELSFRKAQGSRRE